VSSATTTYTTTAASIARKPETWKLNQNLSGSVTPTEAKLGPTKETIGFQKLPSTIPRSERMQPVSVPAHAAAVVPRRQYSPPMMDAPAPPMKIPPVISHQRLMYCV